MKKILNLSLPMKAVFPILLLLLTATATAQPYSLQYKLQSGKTWRYKQIEQTSALAQTNDGRSTKLERKTTRYMTLNVEDAGIAGVQYQFLQDTAVVEDRETGIQRQQNDMENILTRKPIRVRMSPSGKVESTTPLIPLRVEATLGIPGGDALFAQRAAILPALPLRSLNIGDSWTDNSRDTLYPTKEYPQLGRGSGIRMISNATTYTVEEKAERHGIDCLKIRWRGNAFMEEKILFSSLEEYTEDNTAIEGTMLVAIDSGMPIELEVRSEKESTRAVFGGQNTVIPTSMSSITTLEFIPQ